MAKLYPDTYPHEHGMLEMGDANLVYWEAYGNPSVGNQLLLFMKVLDSRAHHHGVLVFVNT